MLHLVVIAALAQAAPPAKPVEIELIEAGAEPRVELRYAPPVRTKQTLTMKGTTSNKQWLEGELLSPQAFPGSMMSVEFTVDRIDERGHIVLGYTFVDIDVILPEGHGNATIDRERLEQVIGTAGNMVLSDRGQVIESKVTQAKSRDAAGRQFVSTFDQSLRQVIVPFPKERVGPGASWRFRRTVTPNNTSVDEVATFTLRAVESGVLHLDVRIEQSGKPQTIRAPREGAPPMKLLSMRGVSEGPLEIDPRRPVLLEGRLVSTSDSTIELAIGGKLQQMRMELTVNSGFETEKN
jgi:hypothetical protein